MDDSVKTNLQDRLTTLSNVAEGVAQKSPDGSDESLLAHAVKNLAKIMRETLDQL